MVTRLRIICLAGLSLSVFNLGFAQYGIDELKKYINTKSAESPLNESFFSISVRDESGIELISHESNKRFIPASVMKLVSTISAYEILGGDYRFKTDFYIKGEIASGVLYGDLIIDASGDPSLGSSRDPSAIHADSLVGIIGNLLKTRGITCITGKVLFLRKFFNSVNVHPSWPWDDLTNYYAAGTYPFNFHENYFDLVFERSELVGARARIKELGQYAPIGVESLVTIGEKGSGDNAYFYGAPDSRRLTVTGTIPAGSSPFKIRGAIPHPSEHFTNFLSERLNWPRTESEWVDQYPIAEAELLYRHYSQPLIKLINYANEVSNNLYCDAMLKAMVPVGSAHARSFDAGVKVIDSLWKSKKLPSAALSQHDGSGLSTRNRLTASGLTAFIHSSLANVDADQWKQIIPSVSKSTYFMTKESGRNRCWLKSGSMEAVQSYAGIVESAKGKKYYITLMTNGHSTSNRAVRIKYEEIISKLLDVIDRL